MTKDEAKAIWQSFQRFKLRHPRATFASFAAEDDSLGRPSKKRAEEIKNEIFQLLNPSQAKPTSTATEAAKRDFQALTERIQTHKGIDGHRPLSNNRPVVSEKDDIKKGAFHKWLGKSPDSPITNADIEKGLNAKSARVRKMAQFAKNMRESVRAQLKLPIAERFYIVSDKGAVLESNGGRGFDSIEEARRWFGQQTGVVGRLGIGLGEARRFGQTVLAGSDLMVEATDIDLSGFASDKTEPLKKLLQQHGVEHEIQGSKLRLHNSEDAHFVVDAMADIEAGHTPPTTEAMQYAPGTEVIVGADGNEFQGALGRVKEYSDGIVYVDLGGKDGVQPFMPSDIAAEGASPATEAGNSHDPDGTWDDLERGAWLQHRGDSASYYKRDGKYWGVGGDLSDEPVEIARDELKAAVEDPNDPYGFGIDDSPGERAGVDYQLEADPTVAGPLGQRRLRFHSRVRSGDLTDDEHGVATRILRNKGLKKVEGRPKDPDYVWFHGFEPKSDEFDAPTVTGYFGRDETDNGFQLAYFQGEANPFYLSILSDDGEGDFEEGGHYDFDTLSKAMAEIKRMDGHIARKDMKAFTDHLKGLGVALESSEMQTESVDLSEVSNEDLWLEIVKRTVGDVESQTGLSGLEAAEEVMGFVRDDNEFFDFCIDNFTEALEKWIGELGGSTTESSATGGGSGDLPRVKFDDIDEFVEYISSRWPDAEFDIDSRRNHRSAFASVYDGTIGEVAYDEFSKTAEYYPDSDEQEPDPLYPDHPDYNRESAVAREAVKGEYEVAYIDNNGKMKRKAFKTDAARQKWIEKQGSNIEVDSYLDPDPKSGS